MFSHAVVLDIEGYVWPSRVIDRGIKSKSKPFLKTNEEWSTTC